MNLSEVQPLTSQKMHTSIMEKRLIDMINPRSLPITLSDIAKGVRRSVDKLYFPEQKEEDETPEDAWKWAALFFIVVSGEGGRFGSYRALPCWVEAVKNLLSNCQNWRTLEELIAITEYDIETYRYSEASREELQIFVDQQKARLHELKLAGAGLEAAWEWARGWVPVIKSCRDEASLEIAIKLYQAQQDQFEEYPEVLEWVMQLAQQQRQSVRVLTSN
jgi:hypothetical protein